MRRIIHTVLFFAFALPLAAQTGQWKKFSSDRYRIRMDYPETWTVNEAGSGSFRFYGEYSLQGIFFLDVAEMSDSVAAYSHVQELKSSSSGSQVDTVAERTLLMYKVMKVNNGQEQETINWVIAYRNRVYHCRYEFPARLRATPGINNELQLSHQMIESITFTD
jgi:hypothetical protein